MSMTRAPVTLGVAAASVFATPLLGGSGAGASPWLSWLVHTDVAHLIGDVAPWIALGLWLEPRTGSSRWLGWTLLAATVCMLMHSVFYPRHQAVFGLSAMIYAVAFAALVAWRGGSARDPRRWAVLGLLVVLLADELLHGASAWRSANGGWGGSWAFVPLSAVESTPLLHAAAAILGCGMGLITRTGGSTTQPGEGGAKESGRRLGAPINA